MKGTIKKTIIFIILLLPAILYGQSRKELEERISKAENEIQRANRVLVSLEKQEKQKYNEILILKKKINLRRELIESLKIEISLIDNQVAAKQNLINKLELNLAKLKKEYAQMIYYAYKNRNNYDRLMFILAAEDFNQAYRRLKYLEQYTEYRRKQANEIKIQQKKLEYEIAYLADIKQEKEEVIEKRKNEERLLLREQNQEKISIRNLKRRENTLRENVRKNERIKEQLKNAISELIAKEAKANTYYKELNSEEERISSSFYNLKGKHMWPVDEYLVIKKFGVQDHAILNGVKINSEGIDIKVIDNTEVKTIFDGEIKRVIAIPGANMSIIIRHGHYLSVYSNIINVTVRNGDKVKKGDVIGNVYSSDISENSRVLHFRIYEENNKQNPIYWLSNK